ncbi:MAG TPA: NAD(+)/NADH kinase [Salinivirgaceae bacterium]|nr:NAD(+)/NADH kinase [Salinivirgaceae bacterium]
MIQQSIHHIGIYARTIPVDFWQPFLQMIRFLQEKKLSYSIYKPLIEEIQEIEPRFEAISFLNHEDFPLDIDFMLSIGGDGTMLEALTIIRDRRIPVLGINTGRLAFLSEVFPVDLHQALEMVMEGKYVLQPRTLLQVSSPGTFINEYPFALNDFTIKKSDKDTLTRLTVNVDGDYLNTYWADGLIISTATGSTAYNLSVGGPILMPCSKELIIVPIASHNLTVRPLVIRENSVIEICVQKRAFPHVATLDNRNIILPESTRIIVTTAPFTFNIAQIYGRSFFNTLRNKLMWGVDKRN